MAEPGQNILIYNTLKLENSRMGPPWGWPNGVLKWTKIIVALPVAQALKNFGSLYNTIWWCMVQVLCRYLWSLVSRWLKAICQFDPFIETMVRDNLQGSIALCRNNMAEPMPFGTKKDNIQIHGRKIDTFTVQFSLFILDLLWEHFWLGELLGSAQFWSG